MHASIFVQIGQCGNQLGRDILEDLYATLDEDSKELYFRSLDSCRSLDIARALCIDTESKVLNELNAFNSIPSTRVNNDGNKWVYDASTNNYPFYENVHYSGSGNNWAMGYGNSSNEFLQYTVDKIFHELEYCDNYANFFLLHSLSGGTGSGIGSSISEELSDLVPNSTRINLTVAPFSSTLKEIVNHSMNASLCLSRINSCSDAIMLFENEKMKEMCTNKHRLSSNKHQKNVDIKELNKMISSNLIPFLLPRVNNGFDAMTSSTFENDISYLCSYPFLNILTSSTLPISHVPISINNSHTLMDPQTRTKGEKNFRRLLSNHLSKIFVEDDTIGHAIIHQQNIGSNLGVLSMKSSNSTGKYQSKASLVTLYGTSQRNRFYSDFLRDETTNDYIHGILKRQIRLNFSHYLYQNSFTLCTCRTSNSQEILPFLSELLLSCTKQLCVGAYCHHYEKYGMSVHDLQDSLTNLKDIVCAYQQL